jgi:methyltransferase-like protein/2-polyprenyl-3-methyl-5-hydroxy-6-metoxy-1,4-benzoquinol methylase
MRISESKALSGILSGRESGSPISPYDETPYPAGAYAQSHVRRLGSLGTLFGMAPPDPRKCHVLELGCADGSNLIPMACALPHSTFLGVDASGRQIQAGVEVIDALGLRNIELLHCDILDIGPDFGRWDYIITHGVYSWVPREVQHAILLACSTLLSPNGIAYISYNTYPGWRMRGLLRDMMLYHSRKFPDPKARIEQARALIDWLSTTVAAEGTAYGALLRSEMEQMRHWHDTYFRHDSLGEINEPVYFHEFMERVEPYGLQYLAEAELPSMLANNYPEPVRETLERLGRDIIELEQYMDFVRNRMFRQTLLCRSGIQLSRSLGPWSLTPFHIAGLLRPSNPGMDLLSDQEEVFLGRGSLTVSTSDPVTKAAFHCLREAWPASISYGELASRALDRLRAEGGVGPEVEPELGMEGLGSALLHCVLWGACELHAHPPDFVLHPGDLPEACPLARLQASRGRPVVNRRHERVDLDEGGIRLLSLLDGTNDRASLLQILRGPMALGSVPAEMEDGLPNHVEERLQGLSERLERGLEELARQALLI